MTGSLADVVAGFKPATRSLTVHMRGDLIREWQALANEYEAMSLPPMTEDGPLNSPDDARRDEIWKRIQELEREFIESAVTLEFIALGSTALRLLQSAHPPTDEQRALGYPVNPDTYDVALTAACLVSPKGTIEDVEHLFDVIHEGARLQIGQTLLELNQLTTTLPKFVRRSAAEVLTERLSNTADATVSPDLFSSVE